MAGTKTSGAGGNFRVCSGRLSRPALMARKSVVLWLLGYILMAVTILKRRFRQFGFPNFTGGFSYTA
jgi:hypothetical protein